MMENHFQHLDDLLDEGNIITPKSRMIMHNYKK